MILGVSLGEQLARLFGGGTGIGKRQSFGVKLHLVPARSEVDRAGAAKQSACSIPMLLYDGPNQRFRGIALLRVERGRRRIPSFSALARRYGQKWSWLTATMDERPRLASLGLAFFRLTYLPGFCLCSATV